MEKQQPKQKEAGLDKKPKPENEKRKMEQNQVDEASKESFPASDPPSWTTGK